MTISQILDSMVERGSDELDYSKLTLFDSGEIPGITIADYLERIMTYSYSSSRTLVMALSYIDKLNDDVNCPLTLTKFNVHRLL